MRFGKRIRFNSYFTQIDIFSQCNKRSFRNKVSIIYLDVQAKKAPRSRSHVNELLHMRIQPEVSKVTLVIGYFFHQTITSRVSCRYLFTYSSNVNILFLVVHEHIGHHNVSTILYVMEFQVFRLK